MRVCVWHQSNLVSACCLSRSCVRHNRGDPNVRGVVPYLCVRAISRPTLESPDCLRCLLDTLSPCLQSDREPEGAHASETTQLARKESRAALFLHTPVPQAADLPGPCAETTSKAAGSMHVCSSVAFRCGRCHRAQTVAGAAATNLSTTSCTQQTPRAHCSLRASRSAPPGGAPSFNEKKCTRLGVAGTLSRQASAASHTLPSGRQHESESLDTRSNEKRDASTSCGGAEKKTASCEYSPGGAVVRCMSWRVCARGRAQGWGHLLARRVAPHVEREAVDRLRVVVPPLLHTVNLFTSPSFEPGAGLPFVYLKTDPRELRNSCSKFVPYMSQH